MRQIPSIEESKVLNGGGIRYLSFRYDPAVYLLVSPEVLPIFTQGILDLVSMSENFSGMVTTVQDYVQSWSTDLYLRLFDDEGSEIDPAIDFSGDILLYVEAYVPSKAVH